MEVTPHHPQDISELKKRVRTEKNAKQRDRYRAILLALKDEMTLDIATKLGRSRRFVQKWVYRYRDEGLEGMLARPLPGRPVHLPRSVEAAFKTRIEAGPTEQDGVCTLRALDFQRILEEEFGVSYSVKGVYDLLHRLNYSCLTPRPQHRKNDPEAMARWKERAPFLSGKSRSNTPTGK